MSTGNVNSFNNNNSFNNTVNNFITNLDDDGRKILKWLSPLEPQQRHQGVRTKRLNGVGHWVLETSEFRKWRDGEDGCVEPVLFCYGSPGAGKTYVSSLVIDSLCDQAAGKDVAILGLYCDFYAQHEQSTTNMLGAMLKQLVTRREIPTHIRKAFKEAEREFGGRGLQLADMAAALKNTIPSRSRLFICIDALDECIPKHRKELIDTLREIVRVSPGARVFLTARPHIKGEVVGCFRKALTIPLSPLPGDIMNYLEMRLRDDTDPHAMDDKLRADIMRIIPEKISESFLLVSLNMDAILDEITLTRRRKKLDEMTKGDGLVGAYTETLKRMQAMPPSRSKLGMDVLMWVSHAERPLHVDELCHAPGVEKESIDLDARNIPKIEQLLACSLGLVTVEKSSSTVRLVHYTLQEYLSNNTNLFPNSHSMIAEVCLTYLNFRCVRGFSSSLRSVPSTAPFVEYASCHWGTHARSGTTERVESLALKLLDGYDKHISSKIVLLRGVRAEEQPFDPEDTPTGFTGLHGAAYFGYLKIAVALLEMNKGDVQATDFHGNQAIAWASKRGHEEVVRVLLERSYINSNGSGTEYGSAPLLWAAENGHEGIVKVLLERSDINPDEPDSWRRTPLLWASRQGHEGVVRMLLERNDVNPDKPDRWHRTPLSWASQNGHEGVLGMLLERNDVNPDKADLVREAALAHACWMGHEGVVRMLLERNDVDPDKPNICGLTPLSQASVNRHVGIVRMLLERDDVNPNLRDWFALTPLNWASLGGNEEAIRILLERSNSKTHELSKWHRRLLWLGSRDFIPEGRELRMILERQPL